MIKGVGVLHVATEWPLLFDWLDGHPAAESALALGLVLLIAAVTVAIARRYVLRLLKAFARRSPTQWDDLLVEQGVFDILIWLLPVLIVYQGLTFVPHLSGELTALLQRVAMATMTMIIVRALSAVLVTINLIYNRFAVAKHRSIKGYIQVGQILVYLFGIIIAIATMANQSPWYFISGLSAMMAIFLLVFRDTLLSLVAGIQLTHNDLIRVGDWIEVPQFGADGDVIDIALHSVKVRNWDHTISVIPTHQFLENSFKNWRGMQESGGRRIKRAINIDMTTVGFLTDTEIDNLYRFKLLRAYLDEKRLEIAHWNTENGVDASSLVNGRRLTNIGTFRAYVIAYLHQHPGIHRDMTFLVRQMASTSEGVPIEVYVFVNDTNWVRYEGIQSDIFDHLLAILPEFGLRVFQRPSGVDVAAWNLTPGASPSAFHE